MPQFPAIFPLSSIDGDNGSRITGTTILDYSGTSVSAAGDVNGDGIDDLIIGARGADPHGEYSGASYVVFGRPGGFGPNLDLSALNGLNGFKISGEAAGDGSGVSISAAGDVNGDGIGDVIVGAPGSGAGAAYVVFGKAEGFSANLDLSALDGKNGFAVQSVVNSALAGTSVAAAGDVNGDGVDDLIVGAPGVDLLGGYDAGLVAVVFGRTGGFAASLDLESLDGNDGFVRSHIDPGDQVGFSVSGAGDIDGDGAGDLVIGTLEDDKCFIMYGSPTGSPGPGNLANLAADGKGFEFIGRGNEGAGRAVSGAGDVNGDGLDDMIFGAPAAISLTGEAYVVFGSATRPAVNLRRGDLDGTNGFRITGEAAFGQAGSSVSSAGDINGDGFDEVIVGAPGAEGGGGASYVIFGKGTAFRANIRLDSLAGTNGFKIAGPANGFDASGSSVSEAGDVNNDGFGDLLVGAPSAGVTAGREGFSYVIYGQATGRLVRTGTEADDIFSGGEFNDRFEGAGGADHIRAGAGDDVILGGDGNDTLDGGDGDDRIAGQGGHDRISGGDGTDQISGGDGDDNISVSAGGDGIEGGAGSDTLSFAFFGSAITIDLATGSVTLPSGQGVQTFTSVENVIGSAFDDTISGDDKANSLYGGHGSDTLNGRGGYDKLYGGTGADTMTGGAKPDKFVYTSVQWSLAGVKRDTITDFSAIDQIDLSAIDADGSLLPGNGIFKFVGTAAFSKPGEVRVVQVGADTVIEANTKGLSGAEMEIVLANVTATSIVANDFIL